MSTIEIAGVSRPEIIELAQACILVVNKAEEVINSDQDVKELLKEIDLLREVDHEKRERVKKKAKRIMLGYLEKNSQTLFGGNSFVLPMIKGFVNDI